MVGKWLMDELPLFPLNTVLFPGNPLRLHIFEERYKRMINLSIESRLPFGVVLIRRGVEALGPLAEPHTIGCKAQITEIQRLPDGRMNILAEGRARFRILSLESDQYPYLVGRVENFPLLKMDPMAIKTAGNRLRYWVERYLGILNQSGVGQFNSQQLPDDPLVMAYIAAGLLQMELEQKQELLSIEHADDLLDRLNIVFRREVVLLKTMLSSGLEEKGAFSVN